MESEEIGNATLLSLGFRLKGGWYTYKRDKLMLHTRESKPFGWVMNIERVGADCILLNKIYHTIDEVKQLILMTHG